MQEMQNGAWSTVIYIYIDIDMIKQKKTYKQETDKLMKILEHHNNAFYFRSITAANL